MRTRISSAAHNARRVEQMKRISNIALFIAAAALSASAAAAMPLAPLEFKDRPLVVPVADGCGFNRYRDARGICRKKYVFTRHQGRQPLYTGCGGVNSHRVCNLYGHCWMVCD
jgi:hypothetical protein